MYAIIRKQSHKKTDLTKVQNHNMRKRIEENVDPSKTKNNIILLGTDNLKKDINDYILNNNLSVRNKTTIVANEFVLTASPEFFFNNADGTKKTRSEYETNLQDWVNTQLKYIQNNKYGVAVNAVLHLDESTPHIHFLSIPIHEQKLNNKAIWRGKNSYSKLIDDYVKVVQKDFPVLQRGVSNEERTVKVTHTTIKEYRDDIASNKTELNKLINHQDNLNKLILAAKKHGFRVGINKFNDNSILSKITLTIKELNKKKDKKIIHLENKNKEKNKEIIQLESKNKELSTYRDKYKKSEKENIELNKKVKQKDDVIKTFYKPIYTKSLELEKENELLKRNNNDLQDKVNQLNDELIIKNNILASLKRYLGSKYNDFINYFSEENTSKNNSKKSKKFDI